ncbi:hypothetical protein [Scytonema sp. NUACC26]|uniref:hypothetical protein n=1 Tax=Scytonema sp. NUACC26 TaxID=3140176 RepID=UPI0034DC6C03
MKVRFNFFSYLVPLGLLDHWRVELSQEKLQNSNIDLENTVKKYYKGLLKLLDALEKHSRGAKHKEVMNIKEVVKTAVELLPSLKITPFPLEDSQNCII